MAAYEIRRLLPRHYKILDLAVEGFDFAEIATMLGMTPVAISYIVNSPIFQDELARRRGTLERTQDETSASHISTAKRMLEEASTRAVEVHEELMESSNEKVRQTSANAILDKVFSRSGDFGPAGALGVGIALVDGESLKKLLSALSESNAARTKSTSFVRHVESTILVEPPTDGQSSELAQDVVLPAA